MLKKFVYLLFIVLFPLSGFAVHLRSGEISYKPVSGQTNTYEITVTVYTNALVAQDLPSVVISFGDGSTQTVARTTATLVTTAIRKNTYVTTHKYSSNGSFIISISPTHRNTGILNIPSSESCSLYVESMLTISSSITSITSPKLTIPPIADGCTGVIYKVNPGAVDSDGDILTYELIKCRTTVNANESNGYNISGYKYPNELDTSGKTTFTMDAKTGEIVWDEPTIQGEYNISFKISIWRKDAKTQKNVLIGYVTRDMQLTISACPNKPPVLDPVPDTCIEAGKTLTYKITSSDPDGDPLTFTSTGVPYDLLLSPATYTPDVTAVGKTSGTFNWNTKYAHIQKNPYQVYYKVEDSNKGSHLSDITSNFITVVAPAVQHVNSTVYQNGFNVKWNQSICSQATGYNIWRKIDTTNIVAADSCTVGASTLGYSLVGTVNDATTLSLIDINDGKGLISGSFYCYIVTAIFADGAESRPSNPVCTPLLIPFIKVIKDTIAACLWARLTIDSTIITFDNASPTTKYTWTSSPEIELTNADKQMPYAKLNRVGSYFLKIVATSGLCTDSAMIHINVIPSPTAKVTLNDAGGYPDTVYYYNKSINYTSTEWKLPDGTTTNKQDSVMVKYDTNGAYRVLLTVYNSLGCPDTISILHKVALKGLFVPNAFEPDSPYADINTFKPAAMGLLTYHIGIWDLWGNLVWESTQLTNTCPEEGWNGCDKKGKKLPTQNYIWRIKAIFIDDTVWKGVKDRFNKYHTEGTLMLIR